MDPSYQVLYPPVPSDIEIFMKLLTEGSFYIPRVLIQEADRLNKRNAELSERIRLLEEGLASIQAGISREIHPLLAKHGSDSDGGSEPTSVQREVDEVNDSLGTLTIDKDGRSLFLGNTAGIEVSC
jgi:hypothetical protein